jgi:hypothetical protein
MPTPRGGRKKENEGIMTLATFTFKKGSKSEDLRLPLLITRLIYIFKINMQCSYRLTKQKIWIR